MIIAFIQIFFNFCYSSNFGCWSFHWHPHVDLWVHCQVQFSIFFDCSRCCKHNRSSFFTWIHIRVGDWCGNGPILIIFLESIPHIDKIPWWNNEYLLIRQIYNFSVLIQFILTLILINIIIKTFLQLKITLHFLIKLVSSSKLESIYKYIQSLILRLFYMDFQIVIILSYFGFGLDIHVEYCRK